MKPEWRTSTVVQLCQGMRETQDYSALPILADALQDAGCDDEKMLTMMRDRLNETEAQKQVALIYSDESAAAVGWFTEIAPSFDLNYRDLIELAIGAEEHGDWVTQHGSDSWRDDFYSIEDKFWDNYELITGKKAVQRNTPFSCSC